MANTISLMSNAIRNVVSKKRIRYKEKGFNLDLTYICDNIIAMGFPAPDIIEGIFRNRLEDVLKFLDENHADHYKIYNLCLEKNYDVNKFHGRVAIYPFEDHTPPTIELIQRFCHDVDSWLKADKLNVVAVHCKAGKGRTGTMICAYLLYSGLQKSADEALAWYDEKRTKDRKGVTIPSQRRYVQYFSNLICSSVPYEKISLNVCQIRFAEASFLHNPGTVQCSVSVLQDSTTEKVKAQQLKTLTIDFQKSFILELSESSLTVAGDIKVELTQKSSRKIILHFWFNTFFVRKTATCEREGDSARFIYTLHKSEIDDAHKDTEHKYFSEDFNVCIVFEDKRSDDIETEPAAVNSNRSKENMFHLPAYESDFNCEASGLSLPSSSQYTGADPLFIISDKSCNAKSQPMQNVEHKGILGTIQYDRLPDSHFLKNTTITSKRKQSSTKSNLLSINTSSSNSDLKKQQMFSQPSVHNSSLIKWPNGASIERQDFYFHSNIPNATPIEFDRSFDHDSSLITQKGSSHAALDDEKEDWESGESSVIAPKALPLLSSMSCSHSKVSPNLQPDDKLSAVNYIKTESIDKYNNPLMDKSCPNRVVIQSDVNNKSNINEKLSDNSTDQRNSFKVNFPSLTTSSSGKGNSLTKTVTYEESNACANKMSTNGFIGNNTPNAPIQKHKIKFKNNKKIKWSRKFSRIQQFFQSDPEDFCEHFVPPNTNRRSSAHSLAGRSKASSTFVSVAPITEQPVEPAVPVVSRMFSLSCPNIYRNARLSYSVKIKSKSSNTLLRLQSSQSGNKNVKDNNEDFYSSICDNQLSFNNSPCKSSRLFLRNSLESNATTLTCKNQNQKKANSINGNHNVVIVSAKPVGTNSIGFNVESQPSTQYCSVTKNEKKLYTFPELSREVASLDAEHAKRKGA